MTAKPWPRVLGGLLLLAGLVGAPAAQEKRLPAPAVKPPAARRSYLDGVAARVNGEVITWMEVRQKMGNVFGVMGYPTREERLQKLEQLAYSRLVEIIKDRLLLQRARAEGIRVSKEEVDHAMDREQARRGSLLNFMRVLSEKGLSLDQFRRHQEEVILRDRYLRAKFLPTAWSKNLRQFSLKISPREIREHYLAHRERYRQPACVWLRKVPISAAQMGGEAKARALGRAVIEDLRHGLAPAAVNRKYGLHCQELTCGVEALEAIRAEGGFRKDIKAWAFAAEPGAVSDLVELGPGSFMVFYLEKKCPAVVQRFEDVQDQIERQLQNRYAEDAEKKILQELFREADIDPPALKRWIVRRGAPPRLKREVLEGILSKPR